MIKYLSLALVVVLAVSCEKHEIEYNARPVADDLAEFQIHYMVPATAVTGNYIYQIKINDSLYTNATTSLTAYGSLPNPSGSALYGRFFTAKAGTVNIKLYQSTALNLVYDQNVTLTPGKQNVVVHNFTLPPAVFDNGYPYSSNVTLDSDSTIYIKFYNFLHETAGVPTPLSLQYQYIYTHKKSHVVTGSQGQDSTVTVTYKDTLNIGQPVAFGETTDWQKVKLFKEVYNSSGKGRVDYLIKTIDAEGNVIDNLTIMNTSGVYKVYSDYWNGYIGSRYHHFLAGCRANKTTTAAVKVYAAVQNVAP